ncbi:deoxyribose-phosphate aldolase [bacterium]|jgi:deoxyribose-phosphate aldolase|nr:deoxyribose-phosphate aldolase [Verrucomicrobiota bacterium]MDA7633031.1 deoxyribose-phosphate aldolase [bacterium]
MTSEALAGLIDHTLLSPTATAADFKRLCAEAIELGCYSVCVPSSRIDLAVTETEDSDVRVCSVVGFPLGYSDSDSKRYETEMAVDLGAHEIDVVINLGMVKDKADDCIYRELREIVEAADERPVKVILETGFLDPTEIIRMVEVFKKTGAHFVKTSTGFGPRGATIGDVKLLREHVGPGYGVKASGGVRDCVTALAMVAAGANRLGASATAQIIEEFRDAESDLATAAE